MKKNGTIVAIMMLVVSFSMLSQQAFADKYQHVKSFTKTASYDVNEDVSLMIDHKYGNVIITEGASNKVNIKAEVKIQADRESMVSILASSVSFDFYGNRSSVRAITNYTPPQTRRSSGHSVNIKYTIEVPKNYKPNLTVTYGSVLLESVYQNSTMTIKYGNLSFNSLSGRSNIDMKYGNINGESVNELFLIIGYGKLNLENCKKAEITTKYSPIRIKTVGNLYMSSGYGNLSIDKADVIDIVEFKYGTLRVRELVKSFNCTSLSYSNLSIHALPTVTRISTDSRYTPVSITLSEKIPFSCNFSSRYSSYKIDPELRATLYNTEKSNNSVTTTIKTDNIKESSLKMNISTSYSSFSVALKQ